MPSNCSKMLKLGTFWETLFLMVSEQTCSCSHEMDKACDKRLNRLISYIHHTCEFQQYCCVGNTAKQCNFELFQDSAFAGDLED